MIRTSRWVWWWIWALAVPVAEAQSPASAEPERSASPPSAVLSRDGTGGLIVRATRIRQPIHVDGRLDEAAYAEVPPLTDFIQQEPHEGAPISEKTEAWVMYDDKYIYISGRMYEDVPPEKWTVFNTGVGIGNTRSRLEHLYGDRQKFEFDAPEGSGLSVTIEIPFVVETEAEVVDDARSVA